MESPNTRAREFFPWILLGPGHLPVPGGSLGQGGLCCPWVAKGDGVCRGQGGGSAPGDHAEFPKDSTSTKHIIFHSLENGWALPTLSCLGSRHRVLASQLQGTPLFVCPTYPYSIPQCVPAAPTALGQATSTGTLPPAVPPLLAGFLMKLALGDSDITRACISVQAHRQQTEE